MATVASQAGAGTLSPSAAKFTTKLVTFSNSYTTGGEAVTAADAGLTTIFAAVATSTTATAGAVADVWYDRANSKLKALTTTAEVANATNLSGVVVEVLFIGTF